ncbi:MAG: hypothetical protein ACREEE_11165, partial [Dongiaceae bacterium]
MTMPNRGCRWRLLLAGLAIAAGLAIGPPLSAAELVGIAFVQPNASLYLHGRTVYLYGVYIPPTARDCSIKLQPVRCGNRAALVLDRAIDGFVHCRPVGVFRDGSLSAVCHVQRNRFSAGRDLAAKLISE